MRREWARPYRYHVIVVVVKRPTLPGSHSDRLLFRCSHYLNSLIPIPINDVPIRACSDHTLLVRFYGGEGRRRNGFTCADQWVVDLFFSGGNDLKRNGWGGYAPARHSYLTRALA